ncbi:MAG TPA: FMN-binding protein, partial [Spirochaetaceae bacterium]|nr:FMN-binding protein [Spirochaetaceae bacterium]
MKRPKLFAVLLAAFALLLSACVNAPESDKAGTYVPGTYTASGQGYGGAVDVSVTVDAKKITAVNVKGDKETEGIGSRAIEELPAKIVAANGKVDAVAGASFTSSAIFEALDQALAKAKGKAEESAPIAFKPGTYTGTGKGYNGDVVLKVSFTENAIADIRVDKSKETEHVGDSAYSIIIKDIKDFTSTGVDTVSGATFTSRAVLAAVEDAAKQAGCDTAALRKGAKPFVLLPGPKVVDSYDVVIVG